MPLYENIFIARQDISATQVEALTEQFAGIVGTGGGNVTKKEYWGLKNLSYRIKKNRKGHYMLLNIDAPPAAVHEMERNMGISEDVLRFLTVRVDELEAGPSAMLTNRGRDRDERPRRFGDRDGGPRRFGDRDGGRDRDGEREGGRFGDRDRGGFGERDRGDGAPPAALTEGGK